MTRRFRRRIRRAFEVVRAAWRAFRYRTFIGAPFAQEALALITVPFRRASDRVSPGVWRGRVRACRSCDLYDPDERTCGSNRDYLQVGITLFPNGCSCLVGIKSSSAKSKCYLETIGCGSKWPSNPSPK